MAGGMLTEGRFDGVAPDLVHSPSGFRVWLTEPFGMISQVGETTVADEAVARFLAEDVRAELERRRAGREIVYVHDWRRLAGYSPAARKLMTEWALGVRAYASRIVIALSPRMKVVQMGVSVATLALQVAGFTVEVVEDPEPVIARLGLRSAG